MRAAVLHRPGEAPGLRRAPRPRRRPPGTRSCAVTAAPIVPLDLLCASGHLVLRPPGDAVRARACRASASSSSPTSCPPGTRVWFADHRRHGPGRRQPGRAVRSCRDDDVVPLDGRRRPTPRWRPWACPAVAAWMALTARGRLQPGGAGARARRRGSGRPGGGRRGPKLLGRRPGGRRLPVAGGAGAGAPGRRRRGRRRSTGDVDALTARFADAVRRRRRRRRRPGVRHRGDRRLAGAGRLRAAGQPGRRVRRRRRVLLRRPAQPHRRRPRLHEQRR